MSVFRNADFYVEHISDVTDFTTLAGSFSACHNETGLERYLKDQALLDEEKNDARTYLVFDATNDQLAGYFSLRTCLVPYPCGEREIHTWPAVELSNFARNAGYRPGVSAVKDLGAYVLVNFVWPLVHKVSLVIGAKFLCLYALNRPTLIAHYEKLGFSQIREDIAKLVYERTKPQYDQGCVFMFQFIGD